MHPSWGWYYDVLCIATASDHMQSHRQRIVKEVFDTEHTYISQLDTVVSVSIEVSMYQLARIL